MKKNLFVLIIGLVMTQPIWAAASKFDQLASVFASATEPRVSDVDGWYSGNCYKAENPNAAFSAIIAKESIDSGNGPLFDPVELITSFWEHVEGAGYFNPPLSREATTTVLNHGFAIVYPPYSEDSSLVVEFSKTSSTLKVFLRMFDLKGVKAFVNELRNIDTGDVYSRCYYYQKVK